jgi:hypothetical protein
MWRPGASYRVDERRRGHWLRQAEACRADVTDALKGIVSHAEERHGSDHHNGRRRAAVTRTARSREPQERGRGHSDEQLIGLGAFVRIIGVDAVLV